MPRVSQGLLGFKHLVLLRKALTGKHSLEIYSREPSMRLTIGEGMFHGADSVHTIRTMIDYPLPVFDWETLERKGFSIALHPKQIFSEAIAGIRPDHQRMVAYLRTFSKLPRVRTHLSSAFRFDQAMQFEYQALYRLSLSEAGASVGDFLAAAKASDQLMRRIGIVIACYCLGDFVSAEHVDSKSKKTGLLMRILAHFHKVGSANK